MGSSQRLADRQLAPAGLVDQRVELVTERREVIVPLAHQKPPPATALYSESGRSSVGGGASSGGTGSHRYAGWSRPPTRWASSTARPWRPVSSAWLATLPAVVDAHPRPAHGDAHHLADQAPGHRVGVAGDGDRTIRLDPAHQVARGGEGRHVPERRESPNLVAGKALGRGLAGRAVGAPVGHLPGPGIKVRFQAGKAGEGELGDGVPF